MTDAIIRFADTSPWLTFFMFWIGCWALVAVVAMPFQYAFKAYNRTIRARNIAARGWPTAPMMDADGDIVLPDDKE